MADLSRGPWLAATPRPQADVRLNAGVEATALRPRSALVAGGTGLVGSHLLEQLAGRPDYERIISLVRRRVASPARVESRIIDFAELERYELDAEVDDCFCALGTTMRTAGSKEAFRRVDFDAVVGFARLGLAHGAERFVLVSAVGADERSRNFYLRVKGEAEMAVAALGFRAVEILRPSLLLGDRAEQRPTEVLATRAARFVKPLLAGPLAAYRPVDAAVVATAMLRAAHRPGDGRHIYAGDDIRQLAAAGRLASPS
ncbi:MAG TPA: NAD-dependent epimerase/dehydratase family protein [Steroidobacteraceae bacterium]|nr:NAD-dependent epimerase/dehydratase family protein [Steroidobacteraceae bacterium]